MEKADYDLNNPLYNQVSEDDMEHFNQQQEELEKEVEEGEEQENTDIGQALLAPLEEKSASFIRREEGELMPHRAPNPSRSRQMRPGVRIANSMLTLLYEVVLDGVFRPFTTREWVCRCDCGNQCVETYNAIYSGSSFSCGCSKRARKHRYKLQGQQFGRLIVGEWLAGKGWECVCEKCGDLEIVRTSSHLEKAGQTPCIRTQPPKMYTVVLKAGERELKPRFTFKARSREEAMQIVQKALSIDAWENSALPVVYQPETKKLT